VENGAAFSTAGFVARVTLTPTLSRGERGLVEQAFIYLNSGKLAISRHIPAPWPRRQLSATAVASVPALLGLDDGTVSSPTYELA